MSLRSLNRILTIANIALLFLFVVLVLKRSFPAADTTDWFQLTGAFLSSLVTILGAIIVEWYLDTAQRRRSHRSTLTALSDFENVLDEFTQKPTTDPEGAVRRMRLAFQILDSTLAKYEAQSLKFHEATLLFKEEWNEQRYELENLAYEAQRGPGVSPEDIAAFAKPVKERIVALQRCIS